MITYQYRDSEGNEFEIRQSIKSEPLELSPHTGLPCKRIITGGKPAHLDRDNAGVQDSMERRRMKAREREPLYTSLETYRNQFTKKE